MDNSHRQKNMSAEELDQAMQLADAHYNDALKQWRFKDSRYESLLNTNWKVSKRNDHVDAGRRESDFIDQFDLHSKTITEICDLIVEISESNNQMFEEQVEEYQDQWKNGQQSFDAFIRQLSEYYKRLAQIDHWQNIAFLAERIPSHSGNGLVKLRAEISAFNHLLNELCAHQKPLLVVLEEWQNYLSLRDQKLDSNADDSNGDQASHGE